MKKYILLALVMACCCNCATAQIEGFLNTDPIDYRLKVKQLDEFMRRFNQQDIPDIVKHEDEQTQAIRAMTAVFDFQVFKKRPEEVREFVMTMLDNNVKIAYTDSNWVAIAHCNAVYKGKATVLTLELATEKVKDFIYKWVITDAYGDVLNLEPLKRNPGLAISPVENEVNFISLKHITSVEGQNIMNYKGRNPKLDTLSVFFALVNSGQLKIENVQQLEYKFFIDPFYEFTVSYFHRDAMNSGWLISDFKKLENE